MSLTTRGEKVKVSLKLVRNAEGKNNNVKDEETKAKCPAVFRNETTA